MLSQREQGKGTVYSSCGRHGRDWGSLLEEGLLYWTQSVGRSPGRGLGAWTAEQNVAGKKRNPRFRPVVERHTDDFFRFFCIIKSLSLRFYSFLLWKLARRWGLSWSLPPASATHVPLVLCLLPPRLRSLKTPPRPKSSLFFPKQSFLKFQCQMKHQLQYLHVYDIFS